MDTPRIKVTRFQIYFYPKSEYHYEPNRKYYDICHIDYLTQLINDGFIDKIHYVVFYFDIGFGHAAIIYYIIKDGSNYIFAPCYNRMSCEYVLDKYKTNMINILMTTIIPFIKCLFQCLHRYLIRN